MESRKSRTRQKTGTYLRLIKNADYILLHFTELPGSFKGRTIMAKEAEKTLRQGVGFDGSSIIGGVTIDKSDMVMKPDASTFAVCPHYFYDNAVASFICDIYTPDGRRFQSDPRFICQQTTKKIQAKGYTPTAAAELEFYLVEKTDQGELCPVENHVTDKQRYFDIAPDRDLTETYRMNLSDALLTLGINVEQQGHEVGSAQNEITFTYSDPVTTSDNIVRHKFAAKAVATKKYGWTATFMPKPWFGRAGNGMHAHLGLFDRETGANLFFAPEGYAHISQICRYFIGGLLDHAKALCGLVAPTVNSYKRLVPGYEAPVYIAWSRRNRSALVRVPGYFPGKENEARIELRSPDPLCNPYLAYAGMFEAGLDGITKKIDPGDPVDMNIYHLSQTKRKELGVRMLPTTLKAALEEWNCDDICMRALGKENAQKYVELKTQEWKEYEPHVPNEKNRITIWETERYLYA